MAVHIADDVCEDVKNNSADELLAPHKPDQKPAVANMEVKLVMAAKGGKLRQWTKATLSHCLDVLTANKQETLLCNMPCICWHNGTPSFLMWTV